MRRAPMYLHGAALEAHKFRQKRFTPKARKPSELNVRLY